VRLTLARNAKAQNSSDEGKKTKHKRQKALAKALLNFLRHSIL